MIDCGVGGRGQLCLSRQPLRYTALGTGCAPFALCYRTVALCCLSVCLSLCPVCLTLVCCGQTVGWIKMPLDMQVGLGPGDIVLDGYGAAPQKRGTAAPHFSAHVYYGETAGWIRIPLFTEVCLGPGNIVLYGDPTLHGKGHSSPLQFSAHCSGRHPRRPAFYP